MDRGGEAGSTGFGRPVGPVRAASTGPALPAQPARPADSPGWGRFYRRPRAGPAGPRDPSGRPLAGSTVTGPRPPAPTTGLYPAAACGPFLRARSGGAAGSKIPQPAFYYHTHAAVQVATVTLDYSGPQYIATSLSSRTLSRPEPAHAHLCTTLSTPLPRCAVWRRERTRKLPPQPCNRTTAKAQECGHSNSAPVDDADLRTGRASARASIIRALATRHRVHVLCACCRTVSLHAMYYHSST